MMVRLVCMKYLPGNKMSYDEGTARYCGRMTHLKHKQSRYKPYDGIRIYMLNDSKTGLLFMLYCRAINMGKLNDDLFLPCY